MMPRAGGQYVYLREAFSPLWGFLYGWTLFLVIQTGTIAAVAVGFARYFGALVPWIADDHYLIAPVISAAGYALSLSTTQLVGIAADRAADVDQHARPRIRPDHPERVHDRQDRRAGRADRRRPAARLEPDRGRRQLRQLLDVARRRPRSCPGCRRSPPSACSSPSASSQTGSLFSADAWNNITFTAGEVKDPRRNIPLSLALGTVIVIGLYLLANVAYLVDAAVRADPARARPTAWPRPRSNAIFPGAGATIMAVAIMISTFGCNNGLILAGARAYYAMARDGLFFRSAGRAERREGAGVGAGAAGRLGGGAGAAAHLQSGDRAPTAICTAICSTTSSRRR